MLQSSVGRIIWSFYLPKIQLQPINPKFMNGYRKVDYAAAAVWEVSMDILTLFFSTIKTSPSVSIVTDTNWSSPQALVSVKEQAFYSLQGLFDSQKLSSACGHPAHTNCRMLSGHTLTHTHSCVTWCDSAGGSYRLAAAQTGCCWSDLPDSG